MDANNRPDDEHPSNGPHRNNRVDGAVRSIPPPAIMPVPSYELVTPEMARRGSDATRTTGTSASLGSSARAEAPAGGGLSRIRASPSAPTERCTTDSTGWRPSSAAAWPCGCSWSATLARGQGDIDTGEKRLTNDNPRSSTARPSATPTRPSRTRFGSCCSATARAVARARWTRCATSSRGSRQGMAAIKRAMPTNAKSISIAPVVAAFVFAHVVAPDAIEKMAAQLHSGAGCRAEIPSPRCATH